LEAKSKEIYKNNFVEYLLCLALDVGEGMLVNGAEVSRVEDTIERICTAYGAEHVEVFTIISVIHASVRMPDGSYSSQMRRVKSTSMDLSTLEDLNALSRKICSAKPSLEEFDEELHKQREKSSYPAWVLALAWAVAAGGFTFFFGGGFLDALVSAVAGVSMFCIENYSSRRINGIAKVVISSFITAAIAGLAVIAGIGSDGGAIIMGAIMLLVPGVAIGVAMRDMLCGDLLAGMLKTLQAIISALMIAFGYILAVSIIGGGVI